MRINFIGYEACQQFMGHYSQASRTLKFKNTFVPKIGIKRNFVYIFTESYGDPGVRIASYDQLPAHNKTYFLNFSVVILYKTCDNTTEQCRHIAKTISTTQSLSVQQIYTCV